MSDTGRYVGDTGQYAVCVLANVLDQDISSLLLDTLVIACGSLPTNIMTHF